MSAAQDTGLVPVIIDALKHGTLSVEALMAHVGIPQRNRKFNLALWRAQEVYRDETGCQVIERNGEIIIMDRGVLQLRDAVKKGRQSIRKRDRAIKIARLVEPQRLEAPDQRRRERFLDREEGRAAKDHFTVVRLSDEIAKKATEIAHVVKRERRPRSE